MMLPICLFIYYSFSVSKYRSRYLLLSPLMLSCSLLCVSLSLCCCALHCCVRSVGARSCKYLISSTLLCSVLAAAGCSITSKSVVLQSHHNITQCSSRKRLGTTILPTIAKNSKSIHLTQLPHQPSLDTLFNNL